MLAPSRAYIAGAPQAPRKCSPVRQTMAPRPYSAPTPKANFLTLGITMTHSALFKRSWGISSGTWRMYDMLPLPRISSSLTSDGQNISSNFYFYKSVVEEPSTKFHLREGYALPD